MLSSASSSHCKVIVNIPITESDVGFSHSLAPVLPVPSDTEVSSQLLPEFQLILGMNSTGRRLCGFLVPKIDLKKMTVTLW